MWTWFNCYMSGRHEYGPWCEPGTIFLRCMHCGRRSSGWAIDAKELTHATAPAAVATTAAPVLNMATAKHVLPFSRAAAR